MNETLASFTHEGIPDLPDSAADYVPPQINVPERAFHDPSAGAGTQNGVPLFELVVKKLPDGSFINIEYASILTPGDPKSIPVIKVTDAVRMKYRQHYLLWKQGMEMSPIGTPLEMWPFLTPSQIHELKVINIFTVEQLRDIADVNLARVPMGSTLREQARKWLELKVNSDLVAQQEAENQALRDGQTIMENQMKDLQAQITALTLSKIPPPEAHQPAPGEGMAMGVDAAAIPEEGEVDTKPTDFENAVPAPNSKPPIKGHVLR